MNGSTIAIRIVGLGAMIAGLALCVAVGILDLHWAARVAGCLAAMSSIMTGYLFVTSARVD